MANELQFTYDLGEDIGQVRFEIGDHDEGSGPLPDGSNFSDAEVQYALDEEGNVGRACAYLMEILANRYAPLVDIAVGSVRESYSKAHANFTARAKELRRIHGGGSHRAVSVGVNRVDGYSKATPSDLSIDATDESTDYAGL